VNRARFSGVTYPNVGSGIGLRFRWSREVLATGGLRERLDTDGIRLRGVSGQYPTSFDIPMVCVPSHAPDESTGGSGELRRKLGRSAKTKNC